MFHRTIFPVAVLLFLLCPLFVHSQIKERELPKEWSRLVEGARFKDRFLPMEGNVLSPDTWGTSGVLPRYVDNGIEDRLWSYWGGNIIKDDSGQYHLMVCGWLESSPKGHMEWGNSYVFNTVSDHLSGPYKIRNLIGKGHNPEVFQLKDGRYVLFVIDGRYVANSLNGKWEYGKFDFDPRDRRIIEGLSNLSFAKREDGSFVMVCRGGGIWISKDGISTYNQISDKRVYPDVDGHFEDPVIWKDEVQYHMIVNDWLGRIAWYLRSKDGYHWVTDPGEAYAPGIAKHKDGTSENWFKYERLKIYQDKHGRAIQANFAVIDTLKLEDKGFDDHSSKNISIPLNPGVLLEVLNENPITERTKTIRVKVKAEAGFDPHTDIDLNSLRFGASKEVNFGKGCRLTGTENAGNDLILLFSGKGSGIDDEEFAPKLIGKYKNGNILFGYSRLPYVTYLEPMLSARAPEFTRTTKGVHCKIEVQNFGQVISSRSDIKIQLIRNGKAIKLASGKIDPLQPYEKTELQLSAGNVVSTEETCELLITISSEGKEVSTFHSLQKLF